MIPIYAHTVLELVLNISRRSRMLSLGPEGDRKHSFLGLERHNVHSYSLQPISVAFVSIDRPICILLLQAWKLQDALAKRNNV